MGLTAEPVRFGLVITFDLDPILLCVDMETELFRWIFAQKCVEYMQACIK